MDRRTFCAGWGAAALLRAQDAAPLEIGGGQIGVSFQGNFDLPRAALTEWITQAARAVMAYFGGFPVRKVRIEIVEGRKSGVSNGRTFGEHGAHCRLTVGSHTTENELKEDWMCTHEMVHLAFPSVEERHHWMEEGSATYVEPIARVKIGQLTPAQIWRDMVRDMPRGCLARAIRDWIRRTVGAGPIGAARCLFAGRRGDSKEYQTQKAYKMRCAPSIMRGEISKSTGRWNGHSSSGIALAVAEL